MVDARAVLLVRRDGKSVAIVNAVDTGDGWHVSDAKSCGGSSDIGVLEVG